MSNTDSFIEEVTEEVRRDKLYAFFKRWAWLGVLVVLLIVGSAAFIEWQKARSAWAAQEAGDRLLDALEGDDPAARAAALVAADVGGPLPALLIAGQELLAEDRDAAIAAYEALAADTGQPALYRDLAQLRALMLRGASMPADERIAALEPLAASGATFAPLAKEQIALAQIDAGDSDQARATLDALVADAASPAGLRSRAEALRLALGDAPAQEDS